MVDVRQNGGNEEAADDAAAFARLADASAKLFAEQTAAMAVMTALGMSVAGQMTGFMLGAFRPAEPKAPEPQPEVKSAPVARDESKVVPLRPQAPTAEARIEPARPKAAEAKPIAPEKKAAIAEKKVAAKPAVRKPAVRSAAKAVEAKPAVKASAAKPAVKTVEARPAQDDLKKISGIGPRLEKVLNARGIQFYADIAGMPVAALKKIDAELDLDGRVIRDDWAGQAKTLLAGRA